MGGRALVIVLGAGAMAGAGACGEERPRTAQAVPGAPCVEPGRTSRCYTGPDDTSSVGACGEGVTTCNWDLTWSACDGEIVPVEDVCTNAVDDDCDGTTDEGNDDDGDGWGACEGDCCDSVACASDPTRVNPGAFEADGNSLDDDCDGLADNPDPACVAGDAADPLAFARALDLCRETTDDATGPDQRWGVISVTLTRADGSELPSLVQAAIGDRFGANLPRAGDSLVLLSTGHAADETDPGFQPWQMGTDVQSATGDDGSVPSAWLADNGGTFPSAPGCPAPGSEAVYDPVMLNVELRVPTNASSFSLSSYFFSSEFPEYVCSSYNDFFVTLLSSAWDGEPRNPVDRNLAVYTAGDGAQYPVGVNLAQGTGLFRQCMNGTMGCSGEMTSQSTSCAGVDELVDTGFDDAGDACDAGGIVGGGTGWLTTRGNVVPGEVIHLSIALWDTGDPMFDSVALVDGFQWAIDPAQPGTGNQ